MGVSLTLFDAIAERADWLVAYGEPKAVAITAWSFARLCITSPALFMSIAKQWEMLMSKNDGIAMSSLAKTFRKLGYHETGWEVGEEKYTQSDAIAK
jgi:hypothetical protein